MEVVILVRDGKTSKIVVKPPKEQTWLRRAKRGIGRASKNEWEILESVEDFFKKVDSVRDWHFSHIDYYDIYIWDFRPGQTIDNLMSYVQEVSSYMLICS